MTLSFSRLAAHRVDSVLRTIRKLRARLLVAILAGLVGLHPGVTLAAEYPAKGRAMKVILPSGPGSALDLLARAYAKAMSETSGLNVVVENKPGGDGAIGIQSFLQSDDDGYTFLIVSSSWMALNPVMKSDLRYDPLIDLVPITTISRASLVMSMTGNSPFKSLREFIAAAKKEPGKYTCAHSSPSLKMACEYLQASAGIKLLLVPYKTTAAAYVAVGSGEADVIFADAGSSLSHWESGRVKGVAVTAKQRIPLLPNIPTAEEEGISDFLMGAWYGVYFKAGTSPEIIATMRGILRKAGETTPVKDALRTFVHESYLLSGNDVVEMNRLEIERWKELVRKHNIQFSN